MLRAQSPLLSPVPNPSRRPLQPKNSPVDVNNHHHHRDINKPKPQKWIEISNDESNKENPHHPPPPPPPPTKKKMEMEMEMETLQDASLAEELSAIREKLERMRLDKDKTEKMLRERDLVLEMQMNELLKRGQLQRMLEIEVDRLYRLNQLRSSCMISPIRSLRDKEQGKRIRVDKSKSVKTEVIDESRSGSTTPNHVKERTSQQEPDQLIN